MTDDNTEDGNNDYLMDEEDEVDDGHEGSNDGDIKQNEIMLKEKETEDREFPDEVETPIDIPAFKRFARFRSLQNMRNSEWNPKESLPLDYGRIFQV